ncbi:MAG: 3-deoxy-manno-octulosonate cytidylyltransferase [Hyphomicrobiales bacterium]|nr:3-deoxy-manno-octulosonate cytidylyltransferase [Hyphomicrobiales bacterium]
MPYPLILIPARLAATRLPNKPLAIIAGEAMIVHVWRRACEARIGPVKVATDSREIAEAVRQAGGEAVMTREDHLNGSSRIFEALEKVDPKGRHDVIVNVQGDLPTIDPRVIGAATEPLADPCVDIATLACVITREHERHDPSVVKAVGSEISHRRLRALYFTRATAPTGPGPLLHHVGLYAYRRAALERYVTLPPSPLEMRERLEQLRALEAGMRIDIVLVDDVPLGVDTQEDLDRARLVLERRAAVPGEAS